MADGQVGKTFSVQVEGLADIQKMFKDLGANFTGEQVKKKFVVKAARVVLKRAKRNALNELGALHGTEIAKALEQDLTIMYDRSDDRVVKVSPLFKKYNINGQITKVAAVVLHMTEGFNQTNRTGEKDGKKGGVKRDRGKVRRREKNIMIDAYERTKSEQSNAINKAVNAEVKRIESKYPTLLR